MTRIVNVYTDPERAAAYARLGFPATYHLAFRDLPDLFEAHVRGRRALDFGCGAGRSTRFLRGLGFVPVGVDISSEMLVRAREQDPEGRYLLIRDDDVGSIPAGPFDLVLCAFPFDNIPGRDHRVELLAALRQRLAEAGRLVLVASAPELYRYEWATFTTADFPENARAGSGDPVRIVIREGGDSRPVDDLLWLDDDYRESFRRAGLELLTTHRPLGRSGEGFAWISETEVSPWAIYVTGPAEGPGPRIAGEGRSR